ncbi:hypothetical protein [Serratia fonticola]
MFKFELNQLVNISISDEWGEVKGRAEYSGHENSYFVHYKAGNGQAVSAWFDESDLHSVEDENHPGCAVYAGRELPDGGVVEE